MLVVAFAVHGCGGGTGDQGRLRLINASTDFAALDLYSASSRIASGVAADAASGYLALDKGAYTLNLKEGGFGTTLASSSANVETDVHYSLIAYTSGGALKTTTITENEGAPSGGAAKFRVFNTAATEAGNVDVYVTSTACSALSGAATPVASAVGGLQPTYTEIGAASGGTTYRICVTGTGDKTDLRLEIAAAKLSELQVVTLILAKSSGGVLLNGLLMVQEGAVTDSPNTAARIRLAADAASAGVVSATVNGVALGAGVTSPAVGTYKLVPAGPLTSVLTIGGVNVAAPALSATAGSDLTLLVAGSTGAPSVSLLSDDNTPSTSSTSAVKLRLVNGLNGVAGGVTLTLDNSVVADAVAFGNASPPVQVAPSSALAELVASVGSTNYFTASAQTLAAGKVYSVFLLGDAAGTPRGLLRVDR